MTLRVFSRPTKPPDPGPAALTLAEHPGSRRGRVRPGAVAVTSRWLMDEILERTVSRSLGVVLDYIEHEFDGLPGLQRDIEAIYAAEDTAHKEKRDARAD